MTTLERDSGSPRWTVGAWVRQIDKEESFVEEGWVEYNKSREVFRAFTSMPLAEWEKLGGADGRV